MPGTASEVVKLERLTRASAEKLGVPFETLWEQAMTARPDLKAKCYGVPPSQSRPLRGHVALELIRELAAGTKSQDELAKQFGCSQPAIHYFKQRNQDRIDKQAADLDNKFASLWVSQKENRIAQLQSDLDELEASESSHDPRVVKVKAHLAHQIAEEMGQLPNRTSVSVEAQTVNYQVEGVDLDALK